MNIDVVNKQVSKQLSLEEKKVALINAFYWQRIKQHIFDYNPTPINIENLCVIYPDKWLVHNAIKRYIYKLRNLHKSPRFTIGSIKHKSYIENNNKVLRGLLKLRKDNKFTN